MKGTDRIIEPDVKETTANEILELGAMISEEFHERYPYIYTELPEAFFYDFWKTLNESGHSDDRVFDLMQDYILANGLADVQE